MGHICRHIHGHENRSRQGGCTMDGTVLGPCWMLISNLCLSGPLASTIAAPMLQHLYVCALYIYIYVLCKCHIYVLCMQHLETGRSYQAANCNGRNTLWVMMDRGQVQGVMTATISTGSFTHWHSVQVGFAGQPTAMAGKALQLILTQSGRA